MNQTRKSKPKPIPRLLRAKVKPLRQTIAQQIRLAMTVARGDKPLAAALLGIGKTTLYRRLQEMSHK